MIEISAKGIEAKFEPEVGLLDGFVVTDEGRDIAPLHRAPWVGTSEAMPDDAAPLMARLGGDFFCAPFADSEGDSPLHGWPPNSAWSVLNDGGDQVRAELLRSVFGARLIKDLVLRDGHPFVYQRHSFRGGNGRVSVSNHANVSVKTGALIRTSPKLRWETPATPQESDPELGRSGLVYPACEDDPRHFPGIEGPIDLTRYPWNPRHEDFVVGIEAKGHPLGWVAVTRPAEGDLFLSLRNPRSVPMSMFWHSNGGRDYRPWSGRHVGCLGVEEGSAEHMLRLSSETDLSGPGALTLDPDGTAEIRHVIGAIAWPTGQSVSDVRIDGGDLVVVGHDGARRSVPFDHEFLQLEDDP